MSTGRYQYTQDLLALDRIRSYSVAKKQLHLFSEVVTPLRADEWCALLAAHPDRQFIDYILDGIAEGFRVGCKAPDKLSSARKNMRSADHHPQVVDDYLDSELTRKVVKGPFDRAIVPGVHINKIGVIEKSSQPGKWRLIVDLSHPEGRSVNDFVSAELCSLQYVRVDDVVHKLREIGQGTEMAKLDVKSAYRNVPVHPDDRHFLGMSWKGKVFIDAALPFGLRSALKIFSALADAAQSIDENCGVSFVRHYLDDFITCGAPSTDECQFNLDVLVELFRRLGLPLALEKSEGPATCIVFLGILIDTIAGELRLPVEKLRKLKASLVGWIRRKRCTKRELLSITGQLQHAARVVKQGRSFLRHLFDLSMSVEGMDHHVHLNAEARSDLAWWHEFVECWNWVSLMVALGIQEASATLTSDASGQWGCGAFWEERWFQLPWNDTQCPQKANIAVKELIPVVVATALWGRYWEGRVVLARCDNEAVVAVLNKRTSKVPEMMHLLRCLAFFEAVHSFSVKSAHIRGADNTLADDLSRDKLDSFLLA